MNQMTVNELSKLLNSIDNKEMAVHIWDEEQECDFPIKRIYLETDSSYNGEKVLVLTA